MAIANVYDEHVTWDCSIQIETKDIFFSIGKSCSFSEGAHSVEILDSHLVPSLQMITEELEQKSERNLCSYQRC